ncbi:uncharacterized protein LOC143915739 [Arctopsyche grandis]|uniref:uncharacterized protein LOC143915739 n=1 Tax=Arctopsyche grandis TaxID=121162 RepID=UPI00406D7760
MDALQESLKALEEIEETRANEYIKHLELAFVAAKEQKLIEEENAILQNNIHSLKEEISKLRTNSKNTIKENEALEQKISTTEKHILDNEKKCQELESGLKIKPSDSLRLNKAKNMWNTAERFTGIRWDYSTPENIVKGYIVNKDTKKLKTFEFDKDKYSNDNIVEELWKNIESMSSGKWNDIKDICDPNSIIINKENVAINNV